MRWATASGAAYRFKKREPGRRAGGRSVRKPGDLAQRGVEQAGDGHRERLAPQDHKRKAVIAKLVNKSASHRFGLARNPARAAPQPRCGLSSAPAVGPANEEVLEQLKAMLEGAIRNSIATEK